MTNEATHLNNTDNSACFMSRCYTHPYLDCLLADLEGEEWRDIIGYDGIYLVSNFGRIKACQREISMGLGRYKIQPEKIRKQCVHIKELKHKHLVVSFSVDKQRKSFCVSSLVGNAFIGELKEKEVYSKKDKVWSNNKADNIIISTYSDSLIETYKQGKMPRNKSSLVKNQQNLFIYKRIIDGKIFTGNELVKEYKQQVRGNILRAIKQDKTAYKSKWSRIALEGCV